jgi:hypothetical protein
MELRRIMYATLQASMIDYVGISKSKGSTRLLSRFICAQQSKLHGTNDYQTKPSPHSLTTLRHTIPSASPKYHTMQTSKASNSTNSIHHRIPHIRSHLWKPLPQRRLKALIMIVHVKQTMPHLRPLLSHPLPLPLFHTPTLPKLQHRNQRLMITKRYNRGRSPRPDAASTHH